MAKNDTGVKTFATYRQRVYDVVEVERSHSHKDVVGTVLLSLPFFGLAAACVLKIVAVGQLAGIHGWDKRAGAAGWDTVRNDRLLDVAARFGFGAIICAGIGLTILSFAYVGWRSNRS